MITKPFTNRNSDEISLATANRQQSHNLQHVRNCLATHLLATLSTKKHSKKASHFPLTPLPFPKSTAIPKSSSRQHLTLRSRSPSPPSRSRSSSVLLPESIITTTVLITIHLFRCVNKFTIVDYETSIEGQRVARPATEHFPGATQRLHEHGALGRKASATSRHRFTKTSSNFFLDHFLL